MFSPDDLKILDLLWKHYEKSKNYSAAAKIQAKLADRVWYVKSYSRRCSLLL
jgi:hypothetical protein